jgi:hypothetical protein
MTRPEIDRRYIREALRFEALIANSDRMIRIQAPDESTHLADPIEKRIDAALQRGSFASSQAVEIRFAGHRILALNHAPFLEFAGALPATAAPQSRNAHVRKTLNPICAASANTDCTM